jgi:hypothetical protein
LRFLPLSVALATILSACAAPAPDHALVPLLENRPAQPHEELAHLQARGDPGAPLRYAYDELLIRPTGRFWATPPGPLENFEPGAFPPAGEGFKSRGRYYLVEGIAIRYVD